MNSLRVLTSVLAVLSLGMNATLAVQGYRHRAVITLPVVFIVYTVTAAATNGVSLYFRLRDGFYAAPLNPGDFTVLIPTLGFFTGAVLGLRALAHKVEHDRIVEVIDPPARSVHARTRVTDRRIAI